MRSLLALPVVLLLAAAPGLAAGAPSGSGPGPGARVDACRTGTVALTFDDGPSAELTPRLVRILQSAHVPATFFMVGQRVDSAPAAARLVDTSGFLVANHSHTHADMRRQSSVEVRATLRAAERSFRRAGLRPTDLMRPPYGSIDARVRQAVAQAGLLPVLWNVDPRDWEGGSTSQISARILAQLEPGPNIVLQHDGVANSPASIAAVPRVVAEARRRGYCFVGLDERGKPGFPTPRARLSLGPPGGPVLEGHRVTATITLDRSAGRETTVRLRARSLTARPGADFQPTDTRVRIPAGARSVSVSVPVLRDRLDEPTERFRLTLSQPRGLRLDLADVTVVVTDRDPEPVVRGVDVSVPEPASGQQVVPVRFTLARVSARPVRLEVRPVHGTASAADATAERTVVVIPAGRRSVVVPVTVLADSVDEPDEQLRLRITAVRHARVGTRDAVVTITAPPAPPPEPTPEPTPEPPPPPTS